MKTGIKNKRNTSKMTCCSCDWSVEATIILSCLFPCLLDCLMVTCNLRFQRAGATTCTFSYVLQTLSIVLLCPNYSKELAFAWCALYPGYAIMTSTILICSYLYIAISTFYSLFMGICIFIVFTILSP